MIEQEKSPRQQQQHANKIQTCKTTTSFNSQLDSEHDRKKNHIHVMALHARTPFKSIASLTPPPPPPSTSLQFAAAAAALLHLFESQTTLFDADNLTI